MVGWDGEMIPNPHIIIRVNRDYTIVAILIIGINAKSSSWKASWSKAFLVLMFLASRVSTLSHLVWGNSMKLKNSREKESKLKAFHETKKWKYFGNGVSVYCCQTYCQ